MILLMSAAEVEFLAEPLQRGRESGEHVFRKVWVRTRNEVFRQLMFYMVVPSLCARNVGVELAVRDYPGLAIQDKVGL